MDQPDNISKAFTFHERSGIVKYCLFALGVISISLTFFSLSIGRPYLGVGLSLNDGVWTVVIEDKTGPASQAGIREGDTPLEINGQSADVFLKKYENSGVIFGRLIKDLTVIDDHNQLRSVALIDSSVSWQYVTAQIVWFVVCLIFWIIGFYVFFKKPKSTAALLLSLLGLAFGLALSANMAVEREIPSSLWFEVTASVVSPWLLLHFFLVLPEERSLFRTNRVIYLIYLPAVITLIFFPIVGYADGQPLPWFRTIRMFEYGVGFLAAVIVAVLNYFGALSLKTRQQMKIVMVSCLAALLPFIFLNILPEAILRQGHTIVPSGFGLIFIAFIPLGMGYAVITKKLMDIDIIIRRGAIYGLITLVMAIMLSVVIFSILTFQDSLGVPEEIFIALASGVVATFLFGPLRKGIESLLDKLFYKDRYDYRKIIQSLGISLNSAKDLTDVSRLVVGTAVNTLNLAGGCLFVKRSNSFQISAAQGTFIETNKKHELFTLISQHNQAIEFPNTASTAYSDLAYLIPLVAVKEEIGFLCVSKKVSRQDFSSDDIFLLQGIAFAASLELHSAMLINDVSIRDTFVSVASHELRTPLTSIIGYADLLLRRNPPDITKKQWAKRILDSGQRLTAIVDDLLNVSRIQSGKVGITLEKVRLSEVLEEILSLAKGNTNKHEFIVDIEPDLPVVLIDRDKLGQVIGNLLSNAIKYSPYGGRITLSVHNEPDKHQLVISIADEGIGIGIADKESLFKTFHRIKRPETQGVRGSGLGLYIAKEWTEVMRGKIWVESELNKGSTFFVAIPTLATNETRDTTISIRDNHV